MHLFHILSVPGKPIKNSQKPLNLLDSSTALGLGFPWTATVYSLSVFSLFFPPVVRRFYSIHKRSTLPCPILRQHHDLIGQVDLSDRGDWTGWKVEGDSPHLGLVSWCQDTWEMSLTLVWISWRHSGHVSSCKAHSMQIPLCKQGLSSVSAIWSQQRVQQLSLMLTCLSKARRLCLGRMIFSSDASEANSLNVLNLMEGGWRKGLAPKLNSHCW